VELRRPRRLYGQLTMPSDLDPTEAALWAVIAICLVLIGAILTPGPVGINERGALLSAIGGVLLAIGWRARRRRSERPDDSDDST
jgi:hypothetical protein